MNHRSTRRPTRWRRSLLLLAGLATAGLALLPAAPAAAHVRVTPDNPTSGGFSALTFRVPNESATAGTVKLMVTLPEDKPFLYVSTKPVPGWTTAATKAKLAEPVESYGTTLTEAVSEVTWTADKGVQIGPGEYQEFSLSVGPLPDPASILLPATQTYSDGTVVAWDQPTPASGEQPEHPAPVLDVVAATGTDPHGGAPTTSDETPAPGQGDSATASTSAADPVARALGAVGLVAGLGALVFAFLVWRRGSGPVPGS
jgi:periplasmic copper chaperone A